MLSTISGSGAPSWRLGQKWRSWASAAAWKVRASTPRWPSAAMRSTISVAALSVKVTRRIRSALTTPVSIAYAARRLMTRVLPDPAPATMASGPLGVVTATDWASFNPSRRRSGPPATGDPITPLCEKPRCWIKRACQVAGALRSRCSRSLLRERSARP